MTLHQVALKREPSHRPGAFTADEAELRLAHLRAVGFDRDSADKVFEAVDLPSPDKIDLKITDLRTAGFADPVKMITSLPAILGLSIDNIRGKITDLRTAGFADPVKMITSLPAILGYSRERLALCCTILSRLADREDAQLARIISRPRSHLDAVAKALPGSWGGGSRLTSATAQNRERDMNTLAGLPPSTRMRVRIKDILRRAPRVKDIEDTSAVARYLKNLECDGPFDLKLSDVYAMDALQNWATGSYHPALVAYAYSGEAFAIEATFLTPEGALAPLKDPKLLLGTPLNGASVRISTNFDDTRELWIARSIETGFRAAFGGVPRNVVAALRMDNIARVTAIDEIQPKRIVLAFSLNDETPLKLRQRQEQMQLLRDRGFEVVTKVVDQMELVS